LTIFDRELRFWKKLSGSVPYAFDSIAALNAALPDGVELCWTAGKKGIQANWLARGHKKPTTLCGFSSNGLIYIDTLIETISHDPNGDHFYALGLLKS
jgi:hypothetical protein